MFIAHASCSSHTFHTRKHPSFLYPPLPFLSLSLTLSPIISLFRPLFLLFIYFSLSLFLYLSFLYLFFLYLSFMSFSLTSSLSLSFMLFSLFLLCFSLSLTTSLSRTFFLYYFAPHSIFSYSWFWLSFLSLLCLSFAFCVCYMTRSLTTSPPVSFSLIFMVQIIHKSIRSTESH